MSIKYGELKKLIIYAHSKKLEFEDKRFKSEWQSILCEWKKSYNKIESIGKRMSYSIVLTFVSVSIIGMLILLQL